MHQNATNDGMERAAFLASPHKRLMQNADGGSVLPGKGEPGRVMQNQNGCGGGGKAASGGGKMSGQNGFFVDPGIRKKTVSGLSTCPVLAGKRNAFAEARRELLQQLLQAPVQPAGPERSSRRVLVRSIPRSPGSSRKRINLHMEGTLVVGAPGQLTLPPSKHSDSADFS